MGSNDRQCETLTVEADVLECTEAGCDLRGHALMTCDGLVLFADAIRVDFDEEQRFTGAVATGNVTAVEGDTLLTCSRATLEGDRIRGRIEGAVVELKERALPADRLEAARNRAEIRGDLERTGERTFTVEDSELTLCDCGDEPPSWFFRSSSVEVNLDYRANLYWSVLWLQPFGLFQVPVTPPIPAVSIPFARRAPGFLPPGIQLYDGFAPLVDLPFFVPLGDSWDVTITPGLRTDWRTPRGNGLDRAGAPRLGARLRYAPARGTEGELNIQYQRDAGNEAVRGVVDFQEGDPNPCQLTDERLPNPRCGLRNRFAIDWQHRSAITRAIDFTADGVWYSDDVLLGDASLAVTDRVNTYVPSRAQLDLRLPEVYASAQLDYILRLGGQAGTVCFERDETGACTREATGYSLLDNTRGAELDTFHRGPHFELRVPALPVGAGVHLEGLATATRYGPWLTDLFSDELPPLPSQWVLRSYAGGAWLGGVGPVSLRARTGVDWALSVPSTLSDDALERGFVAFDDEQRQVVSVLAEAFAELPLARRFGSTTHLVVPSVGIRSIPWQGGDATPASRFDPWLQRNELTQAVVGLDQEWLDADGRPVVALRLEQPFDLREGDRLQSVVRAEVIPMQGLALRGWSQLALDAPEPFREIGASFNARYRALSGGVSYARWFEDSERFRRTVYQLSGTPAFLPVDPGEPGSEQYVRGSLGLDLDLIRVSYGLSLLLRRPGGNNDSNAVIGDRSRPFIPNQSASIGYTSPCDCWGLTVSVVRAFQRDEETDEVVPNYRTNFTFQIGDYAVGSRNR